MLFPIRDSIRSRIFPIVNTAIIVVCGVAFAYQFTLGQEVEKLFQAAAFIPARLFDSVPPAAMPVPDYGLIGNLATMVASMFMHGGWFHIIGNMWFLYVFGDNVEGALGHFRYLLFYLGGGIVASLSHAAVEASSVVPTVGASGAIAAVLGAYLVWFPHARVRSLVFLGFFITMTEIPSVVFLGFWFLLQFFQGTLSVAASGQAGGVAWFAHIGGFLFGLVVAWITRKTGRAEPASPQYRVWYHN
jgi:membrane associated rhomboid family serine protease